MSAHPAIVAALGGYEPTREQQAAIEHPASPLAVMAGAGSGKTAVMAARVASLIVRGDAAPSQVLGLTFTNKAAQELSARISKALGEMALPPGEDVSVFTYHGFADRLLRDYGPKIGIEPDTALLTEAQAYMLLDRVLGDISFDYIRANWVPSLIAKIKGLAESCANHVKSPEEIIEADRAMELEYKRQNKRIQYKVEELIRSRPDIGRGVRGYIDRKQTLGRMDYGDQIAFAYRLVRERPEVVGFLRDRWPVVLLDEYQDTNIAQRKMMESIYPRGSAITVVGDPDQAIYAWRGASLYNIIEFPQHFPQADGAPASVKQLQVSFRSGKRILDVANRVISAIPQARRGVDKRLEPWEERGQGEVMCDLVASQAEEAGLVADEIKRLAGTDNGAEDGGGKDEVVPWQEIAILCRSRSLFDRLQEKLRDENIPVEVVGLGGLLTTPEAVDLVSYLKVVVAPSDNVAFARVAMGPRWRIHYRDLAAMARWAATNTNKLRTHLQERDQGAVDVDPGDERFYLSEAMARIDEVPDVSDEARARLGALNAEIERLRTEVRGCTLSEAIEKVLVASGIEEELDVAATPAATAARANLASFLDKAAAFAPLEGEASVEAFLDFLDVARDAEDLEVAQPRQERSVKLMTIHQAKGLEFDVVFVPGMSDKRFPNTKVTDNPMTSVTQIPYELREDRRHLPRFQQVMTDFQAALKTQALEEERRLAYVAFTRARKSLRLSAAHWYGERIKPDKPGDFFLELAGAPATEEHDAMPAHESVTVRRYDAAPEVNPMRAVWEARAGMWPPGERLASDPLFPQEPRSAVEQLSGNPEIVERMADDMEVDRSELAAARAEVAEQLELIGSFAPPPKPDERLQSLSVSNIVQLSRCPKQFYWTVVRPLPRHPSAAARLGQEVHRWIEIRSMGQRRLDDPDEPPDLSPEELHAGGNGAPQALPRLAQLQRAFESSAYASMTPRFTEQSFVIALGDRYLVRGRMDAVYVHPDGTWEVVDYKSGREPDADDDLAALQLSVYAIAAQRIWSVAPDNLKLTYFYLSTGKARPIAATELELTDAALMEIFGRVEAGAFEPHPSALCHSCDFLEFCGAGRAFVSAEPKPT